MGQRLDLHALLVGLLGSSHVYFQPPPNVQITYPCIVYKRDSTDTQFADNTPYIRTPRYQVTVIDANPDSETPDKIENLPSCVRNRSFATAGLNHTVFTLYF